VTTTTWKEFLEWNAYQFRRRDLAEFRRDHERRLREAGTWNAITMLPFDVGRMLLVHGADFTRAELAPISSIVGPAVAHRIARLRPDRTVSFELLEGSDTANLFESVGLVLDPSPLAAIRPYLVRIETSRHDELASTHWNLGLTALALDDRDTWGPIAGVMPGEPLDFDAGATFQFDVQGLLRHLAGAIAHGAGLDEVRPAWDDFLRAGPVLIRGKQVDEATLAWLARLVHHRIGGGALAGVGDFLYREVHAVAGPLDYHRDRASFEPDR
jgi:hypothetical protein